MAATAPNPRAPRRAGLNAELIARAALSVVESEGFAALTVRSVAGRLGVAPSALYKHIADMDALVDLVLDRAVGEVDLDLPVNMPWRERALRLSHHLRATLATRPGLAAVYKARDPLGPNSDRLVEAFARCILDAGFDGESAGHAWYTLVHYVIGFEATFAHDTSNLDRAYDPAALTHVHGHFAALDPQDFPALTRIGASIWSPTLDERFQFGLELILDGLERAAQSVVRRRVDGALHAD